ncbi:MAG: hypothetical protein JRF17_08105 [Deltaproteobacteria bacterium]|nr:hypothetical protein [Deltaproteobacteria bacterium]
MAILTTKMERVKVKSEFGPAVVRQSGTMARQACGRRNNGVKRQLQHKK